MEHKPGPGKDVQLVKVVIELDPSHWSDHAAERMWAEPVGPDVVVLRNIPFMAYGVSFKDRVRVEELDGDLVVREVVRSSGHSTYRVFLADGFEVGSAVFADHWRPLEEAGCSFEGATRRLLAIDAPAEADIHRVYELLEAGKAARRWDFEEGAVGHALDREG